MSDCHENCIMEERIRQLEEKAKHNSEEHSKFYENFREFGLSHQKNTMNIESIFKNITEMNTDMKEMKSDLKEIKESPSKSAEKFKSALISAIGSAVGVAIIGLIAMTIANGLP